MLLRTQDHRLHFPLGNINIILALCHWHGLLAVAAIHLLGLANFWNAFTFQRNGSLGYISGVDNCVGLLKVYTCVLWRLSSHAFQHWFTANQAVVGVAAGALTWLLRVKVVGFWTAPYKVVVILLGMIILGRIDGKCSFMWHLRHYQGCVVGWGLHRLKQFYLALIRSAFRWIKTAIGDNTLFGIKVVYPYAQLLDGVALVAA